MSNQIKENVRQLLSDLPPGVQLVAAAKTRTAEQIKQAIEAGVQIIGENYVQEAEDVERSIGHCVRWHFIGHLQKNKVKKAVELFDIIETVDSIGVASEIDRHCAQVGQVMAVLIEVNSGKEVQKAGVMPDQAEKLVRDISNLQHIKVLGLMTMGPRFGNPEDARHYFKETRAIFEKLKQSSLPGVEMKYLSMGMSNSYKIALEEGANIIRLGTKIFGERGYEAKAPSSP